MRVCLDHLLKVDPRESRCEASKQDTDEAKHFVAKPGVFGILNSIVALILEGGKL